MKKHSMKEHFSEEGRPSNMVMGWPERLSIHLRSWRCTACLECLCGCRTHRKQGDAGEEGYKGEVSAEPPPWGQKQMAHFQKEYQLVCQRGKNRH